MSLEQHAPVFLLSSGFSSPLSRRRRRFLLARLPLSSSTRELSKLLPRQIHQRVHLLLRPREVVDGEGEDRDRPHSEVEAPLERRQQGGVARGVALGGVLGAQVRLGEAAVAVHDEGHVRGQGAGGEDLSREGVFFSRVERRQGVWGRGVGGLRSRLREKERERERQREGGERAIVRPLFPLFGSCTLSRVNHNLLQLPKRTETAALRASVRAKVEARERSEGAEYDEEELVLIDDVDANDLSPIVVVVAAPPPPPKRRGSAATAAAMKSYGSQREDSGRERDKHTSRQSEN